MEFTFFDHGEERVVRLEAQDKSNKIAGLIEELFAGTDDMLRLLVDQERIEQIKNNATGIEIKYNKKVILHSDKMADYQVDGLLIPFSGEFAGEDGIATIFLADKVYLSGPLRNTKGMEIVKAIESLIRP